MAPNTATALLVCHDCLLAAAGYDEHETGSTPDREPWGLFADEPGQAVAEGTEEGFSWSPCEGCGSPLGGERYAATWLA